MSLLVPSKTIMGEWAFTEGSNLTTRPASAVGTAITPSNNTYGTALQIGADLTQDAWGLYTKVATGAEGASDTLVTSGSVECVAQAFTVRGSRFEISGLDSGGSGTAPDPEGLTASRVAPILWIAAYACSATDHGPLTPPSGFHTMIITPANGAVGVTTGLAFRGRSHRPGERGR